MPYRNKKYSAKKTFTRGLLAGDTIERDTLTFLSDNDAYEWAVAVNDNPDVNYTVERIIDENGLVIYETA